MSRQLAELCDHGRYEEHPFGDDCPMNPGCDCVCLGGRLVEIDLEPLMAMFDQLFLSIGQAPSDMEQLRRNARRALDAALGMSE